MTSAERTVTAWRPNAHRYQPKLYATSRARITRAGRVSLDCGHTYEWRPYRLADHERMPHVGARMLCALCLEATP